MNTDKYTKETLTAINYRFCNAHYPGITDSDLAMANNYVRLIESTRSYKTPKAGDRIRYTNKYGDYYECAHIEYVRDGIVNVCERPYVPFIYEDTFRSGIVCSTSGGAWTNIPVDKLILYVGIEEKTFCDWGHCGACADGAVEFKANVSVWEYNENEQPYSTKTHNKMYVYYKDKPDDYGYKFTGTEGAMSSKAWRNELEFQAWLETVKGEVVKGNWNNQIIVWYWKQKKFHVSPKEYEALELPEDTMLMNGYRRCKRKYDEKNHTVTTYFVWYWEDDSMEFYARMAHQNQVRKAYENTSGVENELARRKIETGVIKPIDVMKYFKE